QSGKRAVAVKNVTLAEEHLHDHFPGYPVMPESLMIEAMAQTAATLVVDSLEGVSAKSCVVYFMTIDNARFRKPVLPGEHFFKCTFHTYFMESEYLRTVGLDKLKLDNSKVISKGLWIYANMFYNQADLVISPSEFTKKDIIQNGIQPPVVVISNGIKLPLPKQTNTRKKFKLPKSYFVYVGRVSREKNLDILIEAFYQFSRENENTHLVIVGDGPAKRDVQKLIKQHRLGSRVHLLGMVPHEVLLNSNIYTEARAFATASTSETQGVSVLEAMSFGLPIIGVKARSLLELIKDNGISCEPNDIVGIARAMTLCVADEKQHEDMRRASLSLVRRHSLQQTVDQLEKVYLKVAHK
ncbi:glycosyltransferase, partial [Candidatus Roizmanbacteria bacterium]|nr:glycosyltransferase [Candidatus Roizmanbacteria bacterium]